MSSLVGVDKNLINFSSEPYQNNKNVISRVFNKKVFTDNNGFRVPKYGYNYNLNNKSFLILGDSVGFGVGVNEEESVFGILRKDFKTINFYNSSVVGYNIKNYYQVLNKHKSLKNLKDIIIFFCINDIHMEESVKLVNEIGTNKGNKFNIISFLKRNIFLIKINNFLRDKSVLYVWLKNILSNTSERYFMYSFDSYKNKLNIIPIKKNLEKITDIAKEYNIKINLIILPYEFQTRGENCTEDYVMPQKEISQIVKNLEMNYFDYTDEFCSYEKPSELFLKYDPVHLSKKGHEYVSTLLKRDVLSK